MLLEPGRGKALEPSIRAPAPGWAVCLETLSTALFETQATLAAYRALGREHGLELARTAFEKNFADPSSEGAARCAEWVVHRLRTMRDLLRANGATTSELRTWEASARRTYRDKLVAAAKRVEDTIQKDARKSEPPRDTSLRAGSPQARETSRAVTLRRSGGIDLDRGSRSP